MEATYEIIDYSEPMGILIFLHKINTVATHWHPAQEFLLVLEGECEITSDKTRTYKEDDIIMINAYEPHSLLAKSGAVLLALQIKDGIFESNEGFCVDSVRNPDADYTVIKSIMARLIKLHNDRPCGFEALMQSEIYMLKHDLVVKFRPDPKTAARNLTYRKHPSRLSDVLDYINAHYKEPITLSQIAGHFFFSDAYLSRSFEKAMGISFKKYLARLRFADAVDMLMSTNAPIDEIAASCGFPNTRAFVEIHKDVYGCLPSQRRKDMNAVAGKSAGKSMGYIEFSPAECLSKLASYLKNDTPYSRTLATAPVPPLINESISYSFDASLHIAELEHNERTFCTVGRASDLLRENIRDMIRDMQKTIGFKYIKFHGIFDDDMSVCTEASDGRPIVYFGKIDLVLDFLLSVGLKPLIQLSFMPARLARYPEKRAFFRPTIISEPRSDNEWAELVSEFVRHIVDRYGAVTVSSWLFTVWNEAETPSHMFGFRDPSLFGEFYRVTYEAVKEVLPSAKFGSTSILYETLINSDWFEQTYTPLKNCRPDFILLHFYPVKSSTGFRINSLGSSNIQLHHDPHIMYQSIIAVKQKLKSLGYEQLPMYLTEWNSTTSHRDLLNDTAFKGAYVVENIMENYDRIASFGYWSLTDDITELPEEKDLFHGGIGLYTRNGIRKPPYYAFSFLSSLGNKLIGKENEVMVTESNDGYQILLVNYIHYNEMYACGELFDTNKNNRYAAFPSGGDKIVHITLGNVVSGKYQKEEWTVNRHHGSVYDIWCDRFHSENDLSLQAIQELQIASYPKYEIESLTVDNNMMQLTVTLEPHEIRLIRITKRYKI